MDNEERLTEYFESKVDKARSYLEMGDIMGDSSSKFPNYSRSDIEHMLSFYSLALELNDAYEMAEILMPSVPDSSVRLKSLLTTIISTTGPDDGFVDDLRLSLVNFIELLCKYIQINDKDP